MYKYESISRYVLNEVETCHYLISIRLYLKRTYLCQVSDTGSPEPLVSIFSLAAILIGSRDHRTQFWKGAIQGPFHQSLVAIGPVVSEMKIKM
jgi:hypothetical protein